ncbi:MAG: NifB/NifX family molybdenum-iron cluster-binding protein [Candidatus Bathyarchaeota archaeon]|nr:NifB/NifX family molybdenum-iron cluster-binding protein [Candidatus Bathyarchaeota archaeon]
MPHRVVVPVADQTGLTARLAEHFGRAPYFAVVDLTDDFEITDVQTVENTGAHAGGVAQAHENIEKLQPEAIIVYGMGRPGLQTFHDAGITVLKANADTLKQVLDAYKTQTLEELIDGCPHAHHG